MYIICLYVVLFSEAIQKWIVVRTFDGLVESGRNVENDKDWLGECALSNGNNLGKFVHFEKVELIY